MGLIILQILRWALLFLLILLLLIVVILLMVLFIPVRYVAMGENHEKDFVVEAYVAWFLSFVRLDLSYREKFKAKLKIAGFTVYDNHKSGDENERKNGEKGFFNGPKKKKERNTPASGEELPCEKESDNSLENVFSHTVEENAKKQDFPEGLEPDSEENNTGKEQYAREEKYKNEEKHARKEKRENEERGDTGSQKAKNKITVLLNKVRDMKEKVEKYYQLFGREETRITFKRAAKKISCILKQLLPYKGKIKGNIGFDDPSRTGELVAFLSLLYPFWGDHIEIVPYYEEEIMEVSFDFKGRFFVGLLLYQLISLILNKYFWGFIKLMKEAGAQGA